MAAESWRENLLNVEREVYRAKRLPLHGFHRFDGPRLSVARRDAASSSTLLSPLAARVKLGPDDQGDEGDEEPKAHDGTCI